MSHLSRSRRFRPTFDSLNARIAPSTGLVPCPADPTIILPPPLITPTATGDPSAPTLVLNVPLIDPTH